jgi:hypothetical protein
MLSIYQVALDITPEIHRLIAEIKKHDRKLGARSRTRGRAWS